MRFHSIRPTAFTIPRKQIIKRMSEENMPNSRERKLLTVRRCKTLLMKNFAMINHPKTYREESKNTKNIFRLFPKTAFTDTLKVCTVEELSTIAMHKKSDAEAGAARFL